MLINIKRIYDCEKLKDILSSVMSFFLQRKKLEEIHLVDYHRDIRLSTVIAKNICLSINIFRSDIFYRSIFHLRDNERKRKRPPKTQSRITK
jgi:hypothetical protein